MTSLGLLEKVTLMKSSLQKSPKEILQLFPQTEGCHTPAAFIFCAINSLVNIFF